MRYKNNSKFKMLIQLENMVKEVLPNEVFSSSEVLNYGFLERLDPQAALNLADSIAPPSRKYKTRAKKEKKVVVEKAADLAVPEEENLDGSDKTEA